LLRVEVQPGRVRLGLPPGTVATVLLPFAPHTGVLQNGLPAQTSASDDGTRSTVTVRAAGDYIFTQRGVSNP